MDHGTVNLFKSNILTEEVKSDIFNWLRGVAQMAARLSWAQEVAGSSPVSPTIINVRL